jgi:hypothetical protein
MSAKKATDSATASPATVECCPQLEPCEVCDVLNFPYRLPFQALVRTGDQQQIVPVEVTLQFRLTRCSGPLSLGDLIYSTKFDDTVTRREGTTIFERPALTLQLRQRDQAFLPYGDDLGRVLLRGGHGVRDEQSQLTRHQ